MAPEFVLSDYASKREISIAEAKRYPIVAAGAASADERAAFAFESEQAFQGWLEGTSFWRRLEPKSQRLSEFNARKASDDDLRKDIANEARRLEARVLEVSKRLNLPATSGEVLREAFGEHSGDPSCVYDGTYYSGQYQWVGSPPVPDLNWIGWSRRIVSAQVIDGSLALWDQTWFKGRKCYLFGFPFWEFPDLAQFNFDRQAQSLACNTFDP